MNTPIRHVLLVSRDPAFSAACAKELESDAVQVETSGSAEEARDFAAVVPPDIIVLEETGLLRPGSDIPTGAQALEVAARLAALAPLVVVATPGRQSQIGGLLATGAADFVARAGEFLPVACSLVERRLRLLTEQESAVAQASQRSAHRTSPEVEEDFGEVLRHSPCACGRPCGGSARLGKRVMITRVRRDPDANGCSLRPDGQRLVSGLRRKQRIPKRGA